MHILNYTLYNIYSLTLYLYHIDSIGAKLDAFQAPLAERSQSVTMNITHEKRCVIYVSPKVFIFYNTWFHQNHPASSMTIHLIIQCWKFWHLAQKVAPHIVGLGVDSQIHIICWLKLTLSVYCKGTAQLLTLAFTLFSHFPAKNRAPTQPPPKPYTIVSYFLWQRPRLRQ